MLDGPQTPELVQSQAQINPEKIDPEDWMRMILEAREHVKSRFSDRMKAEDGDSPALQKRIDQLDQQIDEEAKQLIQSLRNWESDHGIGQFDGFNLAISADLGAAMASGASVIMMTRDNNLYIPTACSGLCVLANPGEHPIKPHDLIRSVLYAPEYAGASNLRDCHLVGKNDAPKL